WWHRPARRRKRGKTGQGTTVASSKPLDYPGNEGGYEAIRSDVNPTRERPPRRHPGLTRHRDDAPLLANASQLRRSVELLHLDRAHGPEPHLVHGHEMTPLGGLEVNRADVQLVHGGKEPQ